MTCARDGGLYIWGTEEGGRGEKKEKYMLWEAEDVHKLHTDIHTNLKICPAACETVSFQDSRGERGEMTLTDDSSEEVGPQM